MARDKSTNSAGLDGIDDDDEFKPSPREAFHTDPLLCEAMLGKVVSAVPLGIRSSKISMGSGLFAAGAVEAGREIYQSDPLMAAVDTTVNDTVCHYCLKDTNYFAWAGPSGPPARACSACKVARFCSKPCQKAAWSEFHKDECKTLREVPMMKAQHLLVHRLVFWQRRKLIMASQAKAISFLETHFHKYNEDEARSQEIADIAFAIRETTGNSASQGLVWRTVPALRTNCVRIRIADKIESVGYALDLVTAVINHSCDPNAHVFFQGRQLKVRSLKKIAPGDEITISYIDPRMEMSNRQKILQREYFFECSCTRCKADLKEQKDWAKAGGDLDQLKQSNSEILKLMKRTAAAIKHPEIYTDFAGLDAAETQLRAITTWPLGADRPDHMEPLPTAQVVLAFQQLEQGRTTQALRNILKGKLVSRRQSQGPEWVNEMDETVLILLAVGNARPDNFAQTDKGFPARTDILTVACGYLGEACREASRVFGSGCGYTKSLFTMFVTATEKKPDPKPGTEGFKHEFEAAQARLMEWAGVPAKYAVAMSG